MVVLAVELQQRECTRTQKHYCESYQLRLVVMRRLGLPRLAKFDTYPVLRNGLGRVYTIPKRGLANHVLSFGKRLAYNKIPPHNGTVLCGPDPGTTTRGQELGLNYI